MPPQTRTHFYPNNAWLYDSNPPPWIFVEASSCSAIRSVKIPTVCTLSPLPLRLLCHRFGNKVSSVKIVTSLWASCLFPKTQPAYHSHQVLHSSHIRRLYFRGSRWGRIVEGSNWKVTPVTIAVTLSSQRLPDSAHLSSLPHTSLSVSAFSSIFNAMNSTGI